MQVIQETYELQLQPVQVIQETYELQLTTSASNPRNLRATTHNQCK